MPCTPERIWAALRQAERLGPIDPWSEPASWVRQADALGDDLDPEGLRAAEGA
jgi:hypothetical protein